MANLLILRLIFILVLGGVAFFLRPFNLSDYLAGVTGVLLGVAIVFLELRVRKITLKRLLGGVAGAIAGIATAYFVSLILARAFPTSASTAPFLQVAALLLLTYVGVMVGGSKGELLNLGALGGLFGGDESAQPSFKILDTSVIIDGRIADIVETGFMDGTLVIPQFVLHELQLVADSADSLKRNRGRRGLDILQRIQKMTQLEIRILEDDFPNVREVDMKLIELAKVYSAKIVTNDFNLNKVAQLHGVAVLNINELANALKPIVLPGETMRVFILKEGKEYNQGVAYLDDGTMVVVDNAKKVISRTIDIAVTSVLQTTAGKMIFGRFDERSHAIHDKTGERHERPGREHTAEAARGSGVGASG